MENSATEQPQVGQNPNPSKSNNTLRDVLLAIALISSAASLYNAYITYKSDDHSKVIIVDFPKIISAYPAGASVEEVERLMVRTNESIVRLRDAGYMVLDSSVVLAAPEYLYLPELDALEMDVEAELEVE